MSQKDFEDGLADGRVRLVSAVRELPTDAIRQAIAYTNKVSTLNGFLVNEAGIQLQALLDEIIRLETLVLEQILVIRTMDFESPK